MSLVDTTDPAGQVSEASFAALVEQGMAPSEGEGWEAGSGVSYASDSEEGTSENDEAPLKEVDEEDEEDDRDRTIIDFLDENPRVISKFLARGKYCFENLVKQNRPKVLRIIEQDCEKFAEAFEQYPETIDRLLDEEESFLHNYLVNNQHALDRYLQIKPQALAAYFERHPAELNRLFYEDPAILSKFCDTHPSFMAAWLRNRQATVQKYLNDNPALLWNHLRAHSGYVTGGQSWAHAFPISLVIQIPEEKEYLINESIQWTLPKDPHRRKEKLKEMAARGESLVAVRGSAEGQKFIDSDTILEESTALKLSEDESRHLNGADGTTQPERLKWFKGRPQYVKEHGITSVRRELDVETPVPSIEIGPYQRAKSQIFKELHPSLADEEQKESTDEDSDSSENTGNEESSEESSENEHIDHQTSSTDSDDSDSDISQPTPPPAAPGKNSHEPDEQQSMSDSDSDAPLMARRRRSNRRSKYPKEDDDEFLVDTESSDFDDSPIPPTMRRHRPSGKSLPRQSSSRKSIKYLPSSTGGKRIPAYQPAIESECTESDAPSSNSTDNSTHEDETDDDLTSFRALVEYPAPFELIEASKSESLSGKWRLFEEDIAIAHMLNIRDEQIVTGEKRFRETSDRLRKQNGIIRTWTAVKNFWNRTGRARSGFDERKNKKAPLATSQQGKLAEANRAQSVYDEQLAKYHAQRKTSNRRSHSRRSFKSISATPTVQQDKKTIMTPDSISQTSHRKPSKRMPTLSPTEKTFSLEEVQAMQADFQAQQVAFQRKLQEQMNAQVQAQIESSNNQMAAQTKMFLETLSKISGTVIPDSSYQPQASSGKKRPREEATENTTSSDLDEPASKKMRPSPLEIGNISNLHGALNDIPPSIVHGNKSTGRRNQSSRQISRPADTLQITRGNANEVGDIGEDLSSLSWQKGVRDRSKMRPAKYC